MMEPVPDSLAEPVDWMTYPHHELYRMVHEGLDLAGATTVSANWARLGEGLGDLGDALSRIGQAFADAWQGDAADQARHAVTALSDWAHRAGAGAIEVSGCITVEVDNAMHARNAMPAPPSTPPGRLEPAGSVAPNAFTSQDFGSATDLIVDQTAVRAARLEAHRRAAETMEHFQASSLEVYGTVPQFAPPTVGPKPPGRDNPPPEPPHQDPSAPAPPRPPVAVRPVPQAPRAVDAPRVDAGPRPAEPGAGSGVRPVPPESPAPSRPAASEPEPASAARPAGGMPMGGLPAGAGEDRERKRPAYLKEDRDLFGVDDQVVAPPVIGEERGRA